MIQPSNNTSRHEPGTQSRRQSCVRVPAIVLLHLAVLAGLLLIAAPASAQKRDHLTDQETELVRYYQELDKRIEIFINEFFNGRVHRHAAAGR
jgi:hypothetical protein